MPEHEGPPLMLNRAFFEQKENIFRMFQIILGIITAFLNVYCYPNEVLLYCSGHVYSTSQLFQFMVINIFCIIMTILITAANLFGFYDAFYRYNLPILERYLITLFTTLYGIATVIAVIEVFSFPFIGVFILPLVFTVFTFSVYAFDTYRQWKNREKFERW